MSVFEIVFRTVLWVMICAGAGLAVLFVVSMFDRPKRRRRRRDVDKRRRPR